MDCATCTEIMSGCLSTALQKDLCRQRYYSKPTYNEGVISVCGAELHVYTVHAAIKLGLIHKVPLPCHGNVSSQLKIYKLRRMYL